MEALRAVTLSQPLQDRAHRHAFMNEIFCLNWSLSSFCSLDNAFSSFFLRYDHLCGQGRAKQRELENLSHADVVTAIGLLRDASKQGREELLKNLKDSILIHTWDIDGLVGVLLDVAASTWLMLYNLNFEGTISLERPITWEKGPLTDAVDWPIVIDKHPANARRDDLFVKLPHSFTAAQLERIAGIEIFWTSNLAEHLCLRDDDTKLMLFHQASVLLAHRECDSLSFPASLADETLRTLALLVPPVLGKPNPWFLKKSKLQRIDSSAGICSRLNSSSRRIENFDFWRERLVLLERTFDDAEPKNLSQLWFDDRKKTQWFTFWVAVLVFFLTLFFGVVQSVAGLVQAWASVAALKQQAG